MSNSISLTASMRSNLLSLQKIAGQVDLTQNRLSTGLKVNSAIDNPSSYYTAVSLNNRASDLSSLLDSMAQGIQTIKAATEGLEAGAGLLEQAAATATQALETNHIPAKSWFEQQEGVAAVVSTKDELLTAIDSGKSGDIVIYGQIDMGNTSITLKDGQNLTGIGAYGIADGLKDKFSKLVFDMSGTSGVSAIVNRGTHVFSDFSIEFTPGEFPSSALSSASRNDKAYLHNVDIRSDGRNVEDSREKISVVNGGSLEISGYCLLDSFDSKFMWNFVDVDLHLAGTAKLDSLTIGRNSWKLSLKLDDQAEVTMTGREWMNTDGKFELNGRSTLNIEGTGDAQDLAVYASDLTLNDESRLNVDRVGFAFYGDNIRFNSANSEINVSADRFVYTAQPVEFYAAAGLQLGFNGTKYLTDNEISQNISANQTYFPDEFYEIGKITPPKATLPEHETSKEREKETPKYAAQYNEIVRQYDSLIKDSSYKGINLLREQDLTVTFNEDRSAQLAVKGKDASAQALGLNLTDWQNQGDIAQSLAEISGALNQIRQMSSELGNYYSIVTTRENFTQNLINVLTEGADKLTLADMNEESANMLALQTRQQLAVNSLSLASQASQSILKLF